MTAGETRPEAAARRPRVAVVGGSMGGLTAALVLRDIGCEVDVYERSQERLHSRGAGIVMHEVTMRYLVGRGLVDADEISTAASRRIYLDRSGAVVFEETRGYRFTAYNTLYSALAKEFGGKRYHLGAEVTGFSSDDDGVTVEIGARDRVPCDLLVCADGISSQSRMRLVPDATREYAGYVAWRGTVNESELSPRAQEQLGDALAYFIMPNSHILVYLIPAPDGSVTPGTRLANFVWYRNVPEGPQLETLMTGRDGVAQSVSLPAGHVQQQFIEELRATAAADLPDILAEVVLKTPEPFLQVVFDVSVPRMAFGRVCLIGDGAFTVRPHTAAATAKACADAWTLAEAIDSADGDVRQALRLWEPEQLALGRQLLERARMIGRRSQFENSWRYDDESLAFGLYGPHR